MEIKAEELELRLRVLSSRAPSSSIEFGVLHANRRPCCSVVHSTDSCEAKARLKLLRLPLHKRQEISGTQPHKKSVLVVLFVDLVVAVRETLDPRVFQEPPATPQTRVERQPLERKSAGRVGHDSRCQPRAAVVGAGGEVGKHAVTMIVMRVRRTSQSQLRVIYGSFNCA